MKEEQLKDILAILQDEQKMEEIKKSPIYQMIARPQYYSLRGKLLLYSWGKQVEISEEEWKKAEELGWVEPIK